MGVDMILNSQLCYFPWPHVIIDDFLSAQSLSKSISELNAHDCEYEIDYRGDGRIEYALMESETIWKEIYSVKTISKLSSLFNCKLKLNKSNLIQVRRMSTSTPAFPKHNDFIPENSTIVCFLYLSPSWNSRKGGRLLLYKSLNDREVYKRIDPIQNRLVAFETSASHWHSVEKVYNWERISALALWDKI